MLLLVLAVLALLLSLLAMLALLAVLAVRWQNSSRIWQRDGSRLTLLWTL